MNKKMRLSITLDEKLVWKIKHKQTELMVETNQKITLSSMINFLVNEAINTENRTNAILDSVYSNPNLK